MNNSRFATSFYYPTVDQTAVPELSAAAAAQVPAAYRQNVQQYEEQYNYNQQKAFLDSRQPAAAPAAAPEPAFEPVQEEYKEPVMSTYYSGGGDIPLCYRTEFINAQAPAKIQNPAPPVTMQAPRPVQPTQYPAAPQAPPQYAPSPYAARPAPQSPYHQQVAAPVYYQAPAPAPVSPDHFAKNTLPARTAQNTTPVRKPANTYAKMYSADPNEVTSDYAFEKEDSNEGLGGEIQPTGNEAVVNEEPAAAQPTVQYKTHASYPETNFNQKVQNGTYSLEVSDYIAFKNDVQPAYGVNKVLAFYTSQNSLPKYEAPAAPVYQQKEEQPAEAVTEKKFESRFQRTIQPAEQQAPPPAPIANSDYDLSEAQDEVPPLAAFRPVVMSAPSMYQHDNLNDLVSCIDINY